MFAGGIAGDHSVKTRKLETKAVGTEWAQGAALTAQGVRFRVWAPTRRTVDLILDDGQPPRSLNPEEGGYWSLFVAGIAAGARYMYRLDGDGPDVPDPASRFLPDGPHGASEVIDPASFRWTDVKWTGLPLHGQVIYELHVGTWSPEGTWDGAIAKLPALKELGITVIELMPVAEFPGRFGWGYDGVGWFAPYHRYGRPDQFRKFVDEAHRHGIGVILDVVYNHLGPDGNHLARFSPFYFSQQSNAWGRGMNFDGEQADGVRRLVIDNAAQWIHEYHLDGLRLDATQDIRDSSDEHIIAAIARECRAVAGGRRLLLIGENEPQDTNLLRGAAFGGLGLDALWNDDFHHSAVVALTGRRQAYYSDYHGTANEWLSCAKHGFLFQGQRSGWQKHRRGRSTRGLPMASFVAFLENHDQVANSLWGTRLWKNSNPGCHRAMTALLLLGPWTPLLFQGQEWNAASPFHYFADHGPELAALVRDGRKGFMAQFPGCASDTGADVLLDPAAPETFERSRLDWDERSHPDHQRALLLHRDLIALRRHDPTLAAAPATGVSLEIASLGPQCGIIRYFVDGAVAGAGPLDRLLIVNLGANLDLPCAVEPLLAPPDKPSHACWRIMWSSEDHTYGGSGCAEPESEEQGWRIPGSAAVLLAPMTRV